VADATLASVALLGFRAVEEFLNRIAAWTPLVGGALLLILGIFLWRHAVPKKINRLAEGHVINSVVTGFFLTIFNPLTIAAFMAFFSILHVQTIPLTLATRFLVLIGIFCGGMLWWSLLITFFFLMRKRFAVTQIQRLNKTISIVLILLGAFALGRALYAFL
jgi:threonine/homoserine/homoserine lactone efflux protein